MNKKNISKKDTERVGQILAITLIKEFFKREYDHEPDFSDISNINIGTTEFEYPKNEYHEIDVDVSLTDYAVRIYIDNLLVGERRYNDIQVFIDNELIDPCLEKLYEPCIRDYLQNNEDDDTIPKNRKLAIDIIDVFENFLYNKGIDIPNEDKIGDEEEAIIYGSDYRYLEDAIEHILDMEG